MSMKDLIRLMIKVTSFDGDLIIKEFMNEVIKLSPSAKILNPKGPMHVHMANVILIKRE